MVKSIYEQLCDNAGTLNGLLKHAQCLQQLNTVLGQHLDPILAKHCELANIKLTTAVIQPDSPVWAAKLRYQIPGILELLNTTELIAGLTASKLTHIQLRVQPRYQHYAGQSLLRPSLSAHSAALVKSAADAISDPRLKLALSRLSERSENGE